MTDTLTANGHFTIDLTPGEGLLAGTGRFDFRKTWAGDIAGTSTGVMLSAGDPGSGNAGYVALEVFLGSIGGREGTLTFQQFGAMTGGDTELRYEVAPGSGTGELAGFAGTIDLDASGGDHRVTVTLRKG